MICKSVSNSSSDSEAMSAQVFLASFGSLVRPISCRAWSVVLRRYSRPLFVLRLKVLGIPEWMTQV